MSFGISAVYNLAGISIAAAGVLSPVICAILMPAEFDIGRAVRVRRDPPGREACRADKTMTADLREPNRSRSMSVILILILASLTVALAFLAGFIWAVKAGQFEDTCTPAMRILSEDEAGKQAPPGAARLGAIGESLRRSSG